MFRFCYRTCTEYIVLLYSYTYVLMDVRMLFSISNNLHKYLHGSELGDRVIFGFDIKFVFYTILFLTICTCVLLVTQTLKYLLTRWYSLFKIFVFFLLFKISVTVAISCRAVVYMGHVFVDNHWSPIRKLAKPDGALH